MEPETKRVYGRTGVGLENGAEGAEERANLQLMWRVCERVHVYQMLIGAFISIRRYDDVFL